MNHKNADKIVVIEHVINRLFTLQLNQALKLANGGYLIHQVIKLSIKLLDYTKMFREARLEILGRFMVLNEFMDNRKNYSF